MHVQMCSSTLHHSVYIPSSEPINRSTVNSSKELYFAKLAMVRSWTKFDSMMEKKLAENIYRHTQFYDTIGIDRLLERICIARGLL